MLHLDLWAEKAEELAAKELEAAKTPQKTKKNVCLFIFFNRRFIYASSRIVPFYYISKTRNRLGCRGGENGGRLVHHCKGIELVINPDYPIPSLLIKILFENSVLTDRASFLWSLLMYHLAESFQ